MEDVILISSDEESTEPPLKKEKYGSDVDDCIVISFDEDGNSASGSAKQIEADLVAETNVNPLEEPSNKQEPLHEVKSLNYTNDHFNITNSESNSNSSYFQNCLSEFLDLCVTKETNEVYRNVIQQKIPLLKEASANIECKCLESDLTDLINTIKLNKKLVKENPTLTLVYYDSVYGMLKSAYCTKNSDHEPKKEKIIKNLEKVLHELRKKIRVLEETEVDFDENDNSAYIKMQRYRERAALLYKKYCWYMNENPHKGRPCYSKLDISCSKFPEINRAINKHFKNKDIFPTYYDMENLIKKCIEKHKLELSQTEFNDEVKKCFKKLGELLQARRKRDLDSIHCSLLENLMDPAKDNPELDKKLKENEEIGKIRINEICEKYVQLQESNTDLNKTDESNSEPSETEETVD